MNQSSKTRKVHILYKHDYLQFSNFSKYMTKHFDNTIEDYVKVREEQIQEISGKDALIQTKFRLENRLRRSYSR